MWWEGLTTVVYWDQISYLRGTSFPSNEKNNIEKENKITGLPFFRPQSLSKPAICNNRPKSGSECCLGI